VHAQRILLITWTGLIAATLVSWLLGAEHALGGPPAAGAAVALVLGFAKARIVGRTFMEISTAPSALRWTFDLWIVVVATTLVVLVLA